jgi:hypothetical protein
MVCAFYHSLTGSKNGARKLFGNSACHSAFSDIRNPQHSLPGNCSGAAGFGYIHPETVPKHAKKSARKLRGTLGYF